MDARHTQLRRDTQRQVVNLLTPPFLSSFSDDELETKLTQAAALLTQMESTIAWNKTQRNISRAYIGEVVGTDGIIERPQGGIPK